MGCDIWTRAEKKDDGRWVVIPDLRPFDWRSYGMFGFLAGVRNYSDVPPISEPRGLPADAPKEELGGAEHSFSWLSLDELSSFNYDTAVEDRRVTVQTGPNSWSGGATAQPGYGNMTTYREFLGDGFFEDLEKLKAAGAERIVFGFDN